MPRMTLRSALLISAVLALGLTASCSSSDGGSGAADSGVVADSGSVADSGAPSGVDASSAHDASTGGDAAVIDANGKFGDECDPSTAPCATGYECTNAFNMFPTAICSVPCDTATGLADGGTCPAGSQGSKCNMKGFCRP